MKKLIMSLAIVAFLMGGFAINANAQNSDKVAKKAQTEKPKAPKDDPAKLIKDYETNVNGYIKAYEEFVKGDKTAKKPNNYLNYMKKAQELEKRIEGMKDQLSKEQLETFVKLKEKFAKALTQK